MPSAIPDTHQPIEIAVVGGGIIGIVLALGLVRRQICVTVYEQSRSFREIGAGVAFTANATTCMSKIDPQIVDALRRVATSNGDPQNSNDFLRWMDGYNADDDDGGDRDKVLFQLYAGYRGFEGCHRAHFLDHVIKLMPEGVIQFGKRLDNWTTLDAGRDEKLLLQFSDGTTAEADAVIGCDGIKSRVRELLLGEGNPASYPHYSHKVAFRGLIPMEQAEAALGHFRAHNQHMHVGPGAHILHFPVASHTLMNVVAFATDPNDWGDVKIMTAPATRDEVTRVFADWGPVVRSIISLLPAELDKWALFDTYDHPAPTYARYRVCIAGDAAHASSPHHGAGAGIGVEDALALVTVIELAVQSLQTRAGGSKATALRTAFAAYNAVRKERTQWLVNSSRFICDVYEWNGLETGRDPEKCYEEIKWRSHKLWYFDIEGMLAELTDEYNRGWRVEKQTHRLRSVL